VSSVGIRLPDHPIHRRAADLERLGYVGWGPTGGLAARAGMQGSMKPLERTPCLGIPTRQPFRELPRCRGIAIGATRWRRVMQIRRDGRKAAARTWESLDHPAFHAAPGSEPTRVGPSAIFAPSRDEKLVAIVGTQGKEVERDVRRALILVLTCITLSRMDAALAQPYPTRPVTLIVPYGAGGPLDTLTRIVSERMRIRLGQSLVIENVSGASGTDFSPAQATLRSAASSNSLPPPSATETSAWPIRRPGQITASNFYPEIASDRAGEMQQRFSYSSGGVCATCATYHVRGSRSLCRRRPGGTVLTSRAAVCSNCSWVKGFVSIGDWPKLSGKA
jgi:hypothetical protein